MFPDAVFLSTLDFEEPTLARAFRFQIHLARTLLAIIHPKHAVPIRRVKPQPFPAERLPHAHLAAGELQASARALRLTGSAAYFVRGS